MKINFKYYKIVIYAVRKMKTKRKTKMKFVYPAYLLNALAVY